jgi:hypothetical protein
MWLTNDELDLEKSFDKFKATLDTCIPSPDTDAETRAFMLGKLIQASTLHISECALNQAPTDANDLQEVNI